MNPNSILPSQPKFLVYKITNKTNNMIYIGVHSCKCKNCKYMGSGKNVLEAIKKEGVENFSKEILFEFDNKEDMLLKEKELVDESFRNREDTYNIALGGGFNMLGIKTSDEKKIKLSEKRKGKITVIDPNNKSNFITISKDHPDYISKNFSGTTKGLCLVKKKEGGETFFVQKNDQRYLSGDLVGVNFGKQWSEEVKEKMRNAKRNLDKISKTLSEANKGKVSVKDPNNLERGIFRVSVNHENYITGKWVHANKKL